MIVKDIIGIDIGGTNFRIGTVSKDGSLRYFIKKPSTMLNQEDGVKNLIAEIEKYIHMYQLEDKVSCVSIGIPSILNKEKTFVYSTPNLKGLENIDLATKLQEALKLKVYIDRDVNHLLLNDIQHMEIEDISQQTIVGFYIGTGIGNAIIIHGKAYSGKNGVAGELGHIPLYGVKEQCTCANYGCAEVKASGKYLNQLVEQHFPECIIDEIFIRHSEDAIIQEFVENLSIPLATEINILDPDYIVLAGGVIEMEGFPKEALIEQVKKRTRKPYPEANLQFVFPKHTQESGVLGSAHYGFSKLES